MARTELRENELVADLGCGTGYVTIPLLNQVKNVIAIDSQLGMLKDLSVRVGPEQGSGLSYILAELPDLPLKDGSLDHLFLINMLHELDDRSKMVAECRRTLKIGGVVTLVDFQKGPTSMGPPMEERIREEDVGGIFIGFDIKQTYSFSEFYQIELVRMV